MKSPPKVNIPYLIFLRTFTVMYVLVCAIIITMSIILKPWKQEFQEGKTNYLEFSIWSVCRTTAKGTKCYEGELDDAPAWFLTVRWFLVVSTILLYLAVFYMIIKLLTTQNGQDRKFWIPAFLCLVSAAITLTAMLMLVGYWDFGFLEDSRMYRMGWKEDMDVEDAAGYPWRMAWASFPMVFLGFILCVYTHFIDNRFMKNYKMNALQQQAYNAVYRQNGY